MAGFYRSRRKRFYLLVDVVTILILLVLVLIVYRYAATQDPTIGKAYIIDGDTVKIAKQSIRLEGIDAPERKQKCFKNNQPYSCGIASTNALKKMVRGRRLNCDGWEKDIYQRLLATCYVRGEDKSLPSLNQRMVRMGWAVSYYDYRADQAYARANRLGIWRGKFQTPSDWRRENKRSGMIDETYMNFVWQWMKNIAGL